MQELSEVLRAHAAQYPAIEPTDAVKLIYQNEFGGGHMIRDTEGCLAYLRREYDATPHDPAQPLFEQIGNGIMRVNLAALPEERVEELGNAFIRSAQEHKGRVDRFVRKLGLLRRFCAAGQMPFDLRTLDAYLAEYELAGFPAVSHSEAYRNTYRPAYRIVKKTEFGL